MPPCPDREPLCGLWGRSGPLIAGGPRDGLQKVALALAWMDEEELLARL